MLKFGIEKYDKIQIEIMHKDTFLQTHKSVPLMCYKVRTECRIFCLMQVGEYQFA